MHSLAKQMLRSLKVGKSDPQIQQLDIFSQVDSNSPSYTWY